MKAAKKATAALAGAISSAPSGSSTTATAAALDRKPVLLAELLDLYMASYTGRDPTRITHLAYWRARLGAQPFAKIEDEAIVRGLDALAREPARVYHGKDAEGRRILRAKQGTRSPATVNRYLAALAAVFTWAQKRRYTPKAWEHPCRGIEREPEAQGVVRFLSEEERSALLAACRDSSWPRLYLLVLMAITTGARRSELLALTWGDLDLARAVALVRTSKNGQPRALPLVPAVQEELRRFASERLDACLFPARGALGKARHFETSWRHALARAGIRRFRFHDLRHTCASYLAQNGASLLEIADVMGHRQLAMVKRYAHLTTDTKARLVERVLGGIK